MSSRASNIQHQLFEYPGDHSYLIYNITSRVEQPELLLPHWHEELEIAYSYSRAIHKIDGEAIRTFPGQLIITNPESIHSIIPEPNTSHCDMASVVLLLSAPFLEANLPDYRSICFINPDTPPSYEIRTIMDKLSEFSRWSSYQQTDSLYARGLILQLLALLCQQRSVPRSQIDSPRGLRKSERLKNILQFVEEHYQEPILLSDVAKQNYFNPEYFSRYFKQKTGISFSQYLRQYRVQMARKLLIHSEQSILEIALENGFSDERGLIKAFRQQYGVTPLQYRKKIQSPDSRLDD